MVFVASYSGFAVKSKPSCCLQDLWSCGHRGELWRVCCVVDYPASLIFPDRVPACMPCQGKASGSCRSCKLQVAVELIRDCFLPRVVCCLQLLGCSSHGRGVPLLIQGDVRAPPCCAVRSALIIRCRQFSGYYHSCVAQIAEHQSLGKRHGA